VRRALPIAFAIFLSGILSYAISRLDRPTPPPATTDATSPSPTIAAADDPLAQLDHDIAFYRARAESMDDARLEWEHVANDYMSRARLSGDYMDWRRAEDALANAFRPDGFGAYLTRASFNSAMHRIDRVDADLDRAAAAALMTSSDRDAIIAMRGDASYYGGRYDDARAAYERLAQTTRRGVDALALLAQLDWHIGRWDEADALFDEALADPRIASARSAGMRAWLHGMRSTMDRDRGRLDDALSEIEAARALTPDDPHLDELAADIHEQRGDADEALALFRSIARATSSPQAIDGVARLLRARGDTIEADELVGVARQTYEAQIALYPEAAYGHAIDHWLRLEADDVDRMIAIAEGNAAARPYGETRVKLAMAYLLAGRIADARRTIDAVLATEWSTAELHAVNAIVIAREGGDAAAERAVAETIAPGVTTRLEWLAGAPQ
jgi:tetratricopeptide (TPR) repeat protein